MKVTNAAITKNDGKSRICVANSITGYDSEDGIVFEIYYRKYYKFCEKGAIDLYGERNIFG